MSTSRRATAGRIHPHDELSKKDCPVVLHCRSGVRSARALRMLAAAGYTNLYNLKGGILAWQAEVQPELARH